MRVAGRLDSYDNIPCEFKCVPVFIPYYIAYQHYKALDTAQDGDYWAHMALFVAELIPFLNFIPFAVDYFAGKQVKKVDFDIEMTVTSPVVNGGHAKRKSTRLDDNWPLKLFINSIMNGDENDAIKRLNENNGGFKSILHIPFQLGIANTFNNTALHFACYMRMDELIKLLLDEDVEIDLTNNANKSPIECYCFEGELACLFGNADATNFFGIRPFLDDQRFNTIKEMFIFKKIRDES